MDNNLANTTRTNYKYEEDRSDILTMEEDVLIRYDRYIYNILYWYTPTWSYIGHTDKVGSVITFSVCIFVCMFFYVVCNFFVPLMQQAVVWPRIKALATYFILCFIRLNL